MRPFPRTIPLTIPLAIVCLLMLSLTGCSKKLPDGPSTNIPNQPASLPDGKGGIYKTGKPYNIAGRWYEPMQYEQAYDATGIASWYGSAFHGKATANGETYNMHSLSAAHKTIPLPTLMRVTNLENGRSVIVRVNDRGPFVKDRLIDLSQAAAIKLGFLKQGTARVRVQSLELEPAKKVDNMAMGAKLETEHNKENQANTITVSSPDNLGQPATAPSGHIFIQLGAFGSKDNAVRLQEKLQTDFPAAHTISSAKTETTIYRVRIGPFEDMLNIEQAVLSLQSKGFENPMVVIE